MNALMLREVECQLPLSFTQQNNFEVLHQYDHCVQFWLGITLNAIVKMVLVCVQQFFEDVLQTMASYYQQ
jgi:hypothetical protein